MDGTIDERFNTGLLLDTAGSVLDVIRDSPAWNAGLGPYVKVVAKDGEPRESLATEMVFANPTVLFVQNGSVSFQVSVAGRADGSHPHLEPNSEADLLSKILEPRSREKR